MERARIAIFLIAIGLAGLAGAQTSATQPAQASGVVTPAPVAPAAAGGIQGQNIFEVKPDASADPNYARQTNGERAKVQPGNNAPMWRQVGSGVTGYSSLPKSEAPEAGNLIQPFVQYPGSRSTNAGEAWREVRNNWLIPYGGALLLIVAGAIALFYLGKGSIKLHAAETGRKIERFTPFERSAHWANAIAFSILAISGIVMVFGKFFLLPLMGGTLFGWLTYALKNMHNFAGPVFAVSLLVIIVTFVRDNVPAKGDLNWLLKGGGMLSEHQVKSGRRSCGREGRVLGWRVCAGGDRGGLRAGHGQAVAWSELRAQHHAGGAHGAFGVQHSDDRHVHASYLSGHHRHAGRLSRHENRLCRRNLGQGAP
jgi:formate dehydrogenase subunit gamma